MPSTMESHSISISTDPNAVVFIRPPVLLVYKRVTANSTAPAIAMKIAIQTKLPTVRPSAPENPPSLSAAGEGGRSSSSIVEL